jgi:selenophosphate synthase
MLRINKSTSEDIISLSQALQRFLKSFQNKVQVRKVSVPETSYPDSQFALMDYIELHRGDKAGYTGASNSSSRITDATQGPDSPVHSNMALTSAIEILNLLGCTSAFKIFPIYDAPDEQMLDNIRTNLDVYTSKYNLAMEDYSSLKTGKLFYGATAIANTTKELPTRYDQVEQGMEIIVTNSFGSLPAISLYMLAQIFPENVALFEQNNISMAELTALKEEIIKNLSEPHFSLGRTISSFSPEFGAQFDKHVHITAVYPVASDGIFAIKKLAEVTGSRIVINEVPMKNKEIARFATREFFVENSTASANGCHLIVASNNAADMIEQELRKHNYDPHRIGFVAQKENPSVEFGKEVNQYVASKAKLTGLNL